MTRWLRWFDRETELLVGERELTGVTLLQLQELFGCSPDEPMVESFPVGPVEAAGLGALTHGAPSAAGGFDLARYDYFVECDAVV